MSAPDNHDAVWPDRTNPPARFLSQGVTYVLKSGYLNGKPYVELSPENDAIAKRICERMAKDNRPLITIQMTQPNLPVTLDVLLGNMPR